jgi:aspartyl/asparaginyl beta-hydroxylase (cupin superfamily)
MLKYAQLQQRFNTERMQAEVASLEASHWKQHYNKKDYEGDWTVLPLRSINGELENIYAIQTNNSGNCQYADTVLLHACPYLQSVVNSFQCKKTTVRLMKLSVGAEIKEHRDTALSFEEGEARLHIPISTNPHVIFFLDKEPLSLREGECWYLNFSLRHRVQNNGLTDRVHLVIDCQVNDWLREELTRLAALQKHIEAEEAPIQDKGAKQNMIDELRRMNTPVALELAAKLENEL